ncbi:prolipoprotein diacylglyceryl transferase [Martelella endophytica]|uniref:Phosphatidylglycerol--prolipoprotein diacylglyceryl transferase n=1 Tax=Martelella endophytica TaxID=1486262 RepID=A0A0D5LXE4_MAREN|nr:prolipoprotein diacylglyceryl transferase [Martelella endophytica]AJY48113.1 diacylglyceryl transferase [Martelella endophytica]
MTYPAIDPIAFRLGPLQVHWYGLAYVAGILLGWLYARLLLKRESLWPANTAPMTTAKLDDFITWSVLGIVIGGRLGYMLFYASDMLFANPLSIFKIWDGGMSFHGGLIGMIVVMLLFSRRNGIRVWSLFDLIATVTPIGLFFGRIANFINGELWGRTSDVPWAMVFPGAGDLPRHPSQLYEAGLEGILTLVILFVCVFVFGTLKRRGFTASLFVCLYALSRIFVEFFREPDPQLGYLLGGWLTMGMLLSLPMLAIGLWGIWNSGRMARREAP